VTSQHRPSPQINRRCTLCKQLKTAGVAKRMKTIYSSSPPFSRFVSLLYYHSVCRRLSIATRQLQWSVKLLHYHTLCRGLVASPILQFSLTFRTSQRQEAPQGKRGRRRTRGDATSVTHAVNRIHVLIPCMHACMQSDQPHVMHMTLYQSHHISPSSACIHQPVASTTSRLNSHQRGVKPESMSRSTHPHITRTRTSLIEISLAFVFLSPQK